MLKHRTILIGNLDSFRLYQIMGFLCGSAGKESAYNAGDLRSIPGWEDPLEKETATHSSTLAWKIPWAEEWDRLQSMESQSRTQGEEKSFYYYVTRLPVVWQRGLLTLNQKT